MKITHNVCISAPIELLECTTLANSLMDALGHNEEMKLKANHPLDTVSGRVTIQWCEVRALGLDILEFRNGRREVATAENIGEWFYEQGHWLVMIDGNEAYGNTVVSVQYTENDEAPTATRKTTLKACFEIPNAADVKASIDFFFKTKVSAMEMAAAKDKAAQDAGIRAEAERVMREAAEREQEQARHATAQAEEERFVARVAAAVNTALEGK